MPRKKPPLDHTTEATVRPKTREADIRTIEKRLSIPLGFELRGRVEGAVRNYLLALRAERENPPLREQCTLLKEVGTKAKSLQDCISRLGYLEQARLGDRLDLDKLNYDLSSLERRARKALDDPADESDGKRDKPLPLFIREMHAIYGEATGRDDRYTHDPGTGEYTGSFFEFLKAFLPAIGVKRKDSTLADDIHNALPPKNTL